MERSLILRPNGISTRKAKDSIILAEKCDFTDLVDFDRDETPFREKIMLIEKKLELLPQLEMQYHHSFNGGIYLRTLYAPKGALMTSYIYRKDHQCIVSKGVVSYRSEVMGGKIVGPYIFTANAGSKRVVYCHTDMVWTTAIKTDATNVEDAMDDIYLSSYDEWDLESRNVNITVVGG
jgi:hypothetical protein